MSERLPVLGAQTSNPSYSSKAANALRAAVAGLALAAAAPTTVGCSDDATDCRITSSKENKSGQLVSYICGCSDIGSDDIDYSSTHSVDERAEDGVPSQCLAEADAIRREEGTLPPAGGTGGTGGAPSSTPGTSGTGGSPSSNPETGGSGGSTPTTQVNSFGLMIPASGDEPSELANTSTYPAWATRLIQEYKNNQLWVDPTNKNYQQDAGNNPSIMVGAACPGGQNTVCDGKIYVNPYGRRIFVAACEGGQAFVSNNDFGGAEIGFDKQQGPCVLAGVYEVGMEQYITDSTQTSYSLGNIVNKETPDNSADSLSHSASTLGLMLTSKDGYEIINVR